MSFYFNGVESGPDMEQIAQEYNEGSVDPELTQMQNRVVARIEAAVNEAKSAGAETGPLHSNFDAFEQRAKEAGASIVAGLKDEWSHTVEVPLLGMGDTLSSEGRTRVAQSMAKQFGVFEKVGLGETASVSDIYDKASGVTTDSQGHRSVSVPTSIPQVTIRFAEQAPNLAGGNLENQVTLQVSKEAKA